MVPVEAPLRPDAVQNCKEDGKMVVNLPVVLLYCSWCFRRPAVNPVAHSAEHAP